MKLTVGTKVYLKEGQYFEESYNPLGVQGILTEVLDPQLSPPYKYEVRWFNDRRNEYKEGDLQVVGIPNAFWKGFD